MKELRLLGSTCLLPLMGLGVLFYDRISVIVQPLSPGYSPNSGQVPLQAEFTFESQSYHTQYSTNMLKMKSIVRIRHCYSQVLQQECVAVDVTPRSSERPPRRRQALLFMTDFIVSNSLSPLLLANYSQGLSMMTVGSSSISPSMPFSPSPPPKKFSDPVEHKNSQPTIRGTPARG